jgi:mono/diheme cytochrome c family protein
VTPFGTFQPPNISPGPDGIGSWSLAQFDNAMRRGISPDGRHYYPAFPYTSYARMRPGDIADLFAYLTRLPAVAGKPASGDIPFPFSIRRGIGLWKRLYLDAAPVVALPASAPAAVRAGQYLVEGPGHCGECHSPRTVLGGTDTTRWLQGAPDPEGKGQVPGITPARLKWSAAEIADYLKTGFTPDYDSVGGTMVEVQANMAELPDEDRAAIAAYLKAVTP